MSSDKIVSREEELYIQRIGELLQQNIDQSKYGDIELNRMKEKLRTWMLKNISNYFESDASPEEVIFIIIQQLNLPVKGV